MSEASNPPYAVGVHIPPELVADVRRCLDAYVVCSEEDARVHEGYAPDTSDRCRNAYAIVRSPDSNLAEMGIDPKAYFIASHIVVAACEIADCGDNHQLRDQANAIDNALHAFDMANGLH